MGGGPYLSTIILIHALLLLPCCSYGGRSNYIKAASFSSSNPIPPYVISSRLEVVLPDRAIVSPSAPMRNIPHIFKSPPPPPSPSPPEY